MVTVNKDVYYPQPGYKTFVTHGWNRYQDQNYQYYYLWESSTPIVYTSSALRGKYYQVTSVRTPGYKVAKKNGTLPVNPYQKAMFEWHPLTGSSVYTIGSDTHFTKFVSSEIGEFSSAYGVSMVAQAAISDPDKDADLINNLVANTATQLRIKAKDLKTNLPQVYAERKQSIEMIYAIAKTIGDGANAIIHRQYSEFGKVIGLFGGKKKTKVVGSYAQAIGNTPALKTAANGWLSIQMGWKPLLSDIYGLLEEIANSQEAVPPPAHITAASAANYSVQQISSPSPGITKTITTTVVITVRCGCVITAVGSAFGSRLRRLGLSNPAHLLWEVLPLSFVIDWMFPVSKFLESLDASWFQEAGKGYTTIKIETFTTVSIKGTSWNSDGSTLEVDLIGTNKTTRFLRNPMSGLPEISLPSFKNPLSASHILSALSLVIQRIPPLKPAPKAPPKKHKPPYDWGKNHRS